MTKENAFNLVLELLVAEEALDTFNLTRAERNEFQQIVKDAFTAKPDKISIQTPDGELQASLNTYEEYPGINIMLAPSNTDDRIDIAAVEHSSEKGLRVITWGNAMDEDYTHAEAVENLAECREHLKGEES